MNRRLFLSLILSIIAFKEKFSYALENKKLINITSLIIDLISKNKPVDIPAGNYSIDVVSIKLRSNSKLNFSRNAYFTLNKNKDNKNCLFLIDGSENVEISGGIFKADDDVVEVISIKNGSKNISINELFCIGCRLLSSNVTKNYDAIRNTDINMNLNITECHGKTVNVNTKKAFIALRYTKNSVCQKCIVDGYYHGILFWGGDSNPKKNGAVYKERKTGNIRIIKNSISNVQQGGIWGSMGEYVTIDSNYLEKGGDVGIDFEGCNRSTAINNIVKNFRHGGLATFFLCNDILFENNTTVSSEEGNVVVAIFNSTLKQTNTNIKFISNYFIGDGVISSFTQHGSVNELLVQNNKFLNTLLILTSPNNGEMKIAKNKFKFNMPPHENTFIVNVSSVLKNDGGFILESNDVFSDNKWFLNDSLYRINILMYRNSEIFPIIRDNSVEKRQVPNSVTVSTILQK